MISPSSTNPKVTEVGDYIFRVCFIDPFQGHVMAKFAREHLKYGGVALLIDQKSDYSLGLAEVFEHKFTEMGGKISGRESYAQGDTDFRAQLTSLKAAKPEGIYVPGYYTDVGLIARQARELGIKAVLLGGDGWDSQKLMELGGSAIDGAYYSNHFSADDPAPRIQAFRKRYETEFGSVPDTGAALGYDAFFVAVEAAKRAKDRSGPALRDAIASTHAFPGVAGPITFDDKRNPLKPAVVLRVNGPKAEYVATVEP
jgi:branched-chain amino acid transport system substrate-binding protein